MRSRRIYFGLWVLFALCCPSVNEESVVRAAPINQVFASPKGRVENVRFERLAGGVIVILYDLQSDMPGAMFAIAVKVSEDGGKTFNFTPRAITGDITNVSPGKEKKIVWQSGQDVEALQIDQLKFEVVTTSATLAPTLSAPVTVKTDPSGARVYVDEQEQRGLTPLTVNGLSPGAHQVRVEKDGFIENGRQLELKAGQAETVEFKLKAAPAPAPTAKKRSPLVYILPIAGGGAAAAALLAGGGDSTPPTNEPSPPPPVVPPTARFVVLDDGGRTALAGVTPVRFDASASSGPNGAITAYNWTFGDGTGATGAITPHVYVSADSARTFTVSLTVTDARATSTPTQQDVTVRSLTGTWRATAPNNTDVRTLVLVQNGNTLSGTYANSNLAPGLEFTLTGSVTTSRGVLFTATSPGASPFTLNGGTDAINAAVSQFSGLVSGGGSATGLTLTFIRQ